ncbi:unnamed protein product [Spirodela intermedia]|uniref:Uncharacterized protein n=1 Tax=Spirodela intermedia TaxID=51605 RepID=A0A7I8IEL3_SPIIN|nr:unnamed protein product [Spirodela intermedia]CAA6656240.1 unnamed protein product [Spirodela intermedia]
MNGFVRAVSMRGLAIAVALLLVAAAGIASAAGGERKQKYIVYMGDKLHPSVDAVAAHHSLLADVLGNHDDAKGSIFHSYTRSMNAFAAMLSPEEASKVSELEDVISVFPCKTRRMQTTRSWDYIGLSPEVKRRQAAESDVIIGMIDSGIDPTLESFRDEGFGPPPARWKGTCGPYENFKCNRKIIGAEFFRHSLQLPIGESASPLDMTGHGSHTAAIAAGSLVQRAEFFGLAGGTARGGVPSARIAVYKVCYTDHTCNDEDVLSAFDAAANDGVDIINLSLGFNILTAAAAGNQGPFHRSIMNFSPWMLTVGASTVDRQLRTDLILGNGERITGVSVNTFETPNHTIPIIRGFDASAELGLELSAMRCMPDSLKPEAVNGKIVHCLVTGGAGTSDEAVREAGGAGMIVQVYTMTDTPEVFLVPTTVVAKDDGKRVASYLKSTNSSFFSIAPCSQVSGGTIAKSYAINMSNPTVPSFSGRGPNPVYHSILKPDIVAPGVDILSAHPMYVPITGNNDPRRSPAYIKSFHPDWSPAAIKSAMMTTAVVMTRESANISDVEYAYGSGMINPVRAVDPGLIYNIGSLDWLSFLCAQTTNQTAIRILSAQDKLVCTDLPKIRPTYDSLNYPSFHFHATIEAPPGVNVTVKPSTIQFIVRRQSKSFKLVVRTTPQGHRPPLIVSGSLTWSDGVHSVRSPIAVHFS